MTSRAQRIFYVEGNVDGTIGGSYYSLLFLVAGLDRARYEPTVVFARDNALLPRFRAAGVRAIVREPALPTIMPGPLRLLAKAINFLRGMIAEPARLAWLLRREGAGLVHLNNSIIRNHTWMIGARLARIPCITHERGINSAFPRRATVLARRLAAVICISRAVYDNFLSLGLGSLKLVTIHNGLDPAQMKVTRSPADIRLELGVAASQRLVGIVGNIKPWKGQEVVIRAMSLLKDRQPGLVCLLIGDNSPEDLQYRDYMADLIRQLGLSGRVLITGFRADVANYVNALEVQIHASVNPEPFGRVLLEGMALGKPLVASGGGAIPEIVVDGETGFLFEPGDHAALADCIQVLLDDPERARAMGTAGRLRLETEFSIAHNVNATQDVYRSILGA